jgi:hypothetical protein
MLILGQHRKWFHVHGSTLLKKPPGETPLLCLDSMSGMDSQRYCMGGESFRMMAWFLSNVGNHFMNGSMHVHEETI